MFKIIANRKIELTEDEHALYVSICRSYDRPNFKGEDLFLDIFETNDDGLITFLRPPSTKFTSWEVFMFCMTVQQQQQLRMMHRQIDDMRDQLNKRLDEALKK